MDYKNKKVLVCGAARSGIAAAVLLEKNGARVTLQDKKESFHTSDKLKNIQLYTGKNPDDIIADYDCIILSPGIPYDTPFITKAAALNKYIIGEFELACQFYKGSILAITGTNGKTTTTLLTAHLLKSKNVVVGGNIGDPLTANLSDRLCIAEVSSFQLETTDTFKPHIAAVLNLSEDHLDRHYTMDNYAAIKERIFKNQSSADFALLNYDNAYTRNMKSQARTIFFSTKTILDYGVFLDGDNIKINLEQQHTISLKNFPLKGRHNKENAVAAVTFAYLTGISPDETEANLATFTPPPHRLEYFCTINHVDFYNDSKATNPLASIVSIESLDAPSIIIAGGEAKKSDYSLWAVKARHFVLFGRDKEYLAQIIKANGGNYTLAEDLENAVDISLSLAKPNENIVLSPACASFDMFKDYEERGDKFKEIVRTRIQKI